MEQFEILYSYHDYTYKPSLHYLIPSLMGLILFFAILSSFIDVKKYLKYSTRLWLMGISVFGLLMLGALIFEYKKYFHEHSSFAEKSFLTTEGLITNYTKNSRGLKTFTVNGIVIETGEPLKSEIAKGDWVRVQYYYYSSWNRNNLLKLELKK